MSTARFDPRDPLVMRTARTLQETRRDSFDWWTTAEAAAAEEEHIKAMFAERQISSSWKWAERAIYAVCAIAILVVTFVASKGNP